MKVAAHVINLAAKKLAGEATDEELAELNQLLLENHTLNNSLKTIFATWEEVNFSHKISDREIEQNLDAVLKKIHHKINPDGILPDEPLNNC
ncbi:hypothetical protein HDF24_24700 [Mucilaginibacter sp. X4EP1]|uniref:hypothetical protein n=1 Tax=Mucilaginibacter sp. X4EP1 TaxID=2723092 RepID=UPI002168B593|nr:hypothetical protein [Mucilaginibacter sp. X4EP1]MCS3815193.1 hypothetical protein [Mucilaginibacter sp. X4EP1]